MTSQASRKTEGRGRLYDSVVDTIGNTPCIRLNRIAPKHVRLYVKAEFFNPAASVKDRLAISIIEGAERRGDLKPGQTVVEATSGNTGIGLAMVCAAKGYPLVVTMADSFSIERRRMMRFLGAKVVLTPRTAKGMGMYKKAQELAEANGWFYARQFETPDNATIHENTTARELLADFKGERLDYWVTGYGTGGTLTGVGRVLRKERPDTKIILSEPSIAPAARQRHRAGARRRPLARCQPLRLHAASDPGLDAGLHSLCSPGVGRQALLRRAAADRRARRDRVVTAARRRRGHLHRHLRRRFARGRDPGRRARAARLGALLHAARHRRALPVDAAVRGRGHRHDAGGGGPVEVDARLPDACCVRGVRTTEAESA